MMTCAVYGLMFLPLQLTTRRLEASLATITSSLCISGIRPIVRIDADRMRDGIIRLLLDIDTIRRLIIEMVQPNVTLSRKLGM